MTDRQSPTGILGAWIADAPSDWSAASRSVATAAFVDCFACMIAGSREEVTRRTLSAVRSWGQGAAGVVGQGLGLPAPWAALVNGTAAHALDYDDILDPSLSHPSAVLVPAILALAEEEGSVSGERCVDAWLVGLEVMARLGEAFNVSHYALGWHTTLSLGAPSAAAACARLLGLDAVAAAHAIGLSASMSGGSKRQFGSMAKPLHAGLAAKSGVVAACLARTGVEASADVFDGRWGLLEMTAGPEAAGFAALAARLGGPPAAEQYGIWLKAWPSCGATHRPIEAALALRRQGGWKPEDIVSIEAFVSLSAQGNLRFIHPMNGAEARFCLPFCVGSALIDGRLDLASFRAESIGRADIRNLTARFRMSLDPDLCDRGFGCALAERGRVEIVLLSGQRLAAACEHPPGHPGNPMSEAALRGKFTDCAGARGLGEAAAAELWSAAADLPERAAGRPLMPWRPAI
ncbi:2-methylcitrate dehydratase PrpD [Tistlia consotensis]|uniref:2-methylcitrate dehydratase PrpD n=1 Tax=Tistlia consotensis USBA 355 TaxID=560819 RepID=A0A1Y6BY33_9PROT|nr:MmgE/PrpD family protein [Tistlia consotensis]SMF31139.1 2-methylcitrate dehydratase PrpD [Tistlia consotensis USBA 355]SNS19140.1 2-methylcitrate dehydratase PrpD [Tistlia consotensis]